MFRSLMLPPCFHGSAATGDFIVPKLTKRLVESLAVKLSDYITFDSEVAGFGIRVLPSGVRSYLIQYRSGGRTKRLALGKHGTVTAEDARKLAIMRLGEVAHGDDPSEDRRLRLRAPTAASLCDRFLDEHVKLRCKAKTAYDYERLIRLHVRPSLGTFKVADIRRSDVADLHHKMRATPHQANRVLSVMSKMFNTAELWGLRPDGSNPCRLVPKYRETRKERYLNNGELKRLGEVLVWAQEAAEESPFVIAAFRLLLLTGCRLSEIQTMKWEYVALHHLILPDSKTGARRIPLSQEAHAVMNALPRSLDNPYVIEGKWAGTHITDLQRPWRRLRNIAQLDDVRIHDLRHTFASLAAMNGVDLLTLGKILGHSNYQTTERYAHLADDGIRNAAEAVSNLMSSAISQPATIPEKRLRVVK